MPGQNNDTNDNVGNTQEDNQQTQNTQDTQNTQNQTNDTSIDKLVEQRVNESLKEIKAKLDKAYGSRDEATRKLAELEAREKEARLKQMEEDGRKVEALEERLAESSAKLQVAEKRIIELTRDVDVRDAMANLPFRSDRARNIATREIVDSLVQNDKGVWQHKSGVSVKDAVEAFANDDDQSFLFKAKQSSGTGSTGSAPKDGDRTDKKKSVFELTQAEMLERTRKRLGRA